VKNALPFVLWLCAGIVGLSGCRCAHDGSADLARRANDFFGKAQGERILFAAELQRRLGVGEAIFVLDVRDQASYEKAHIPNAVNIPLESLFTEASLKQLPANGTPVVVVSANGHPGSMAAGVLGSMGYNAFALRLGMVGWSRSTPMQVASESQAPQVLTGLGGPTTP
jgi:rhodanese-related sulfurtransferase